MTKRTIKRNIFCPENSKLYPIRWQRIKIAESRNLLRIILNIKQEEMLKFKSANKRVQEQLKYEEEQNDHEIEAEESCSEQNGKFQHFENFSFKNLAKRSKSKLTRMEKEANQYPQLFEKVLQTLLKKAELLKCEIKRKKGLCPDTEFIPENSHVCQYCGRKFEKPCSLGGHISKLHSQEKRRDRDLKELNDFSFETPVKRR